MNQIDAYFTTFPAEVQDRLSQIRSIIRDNAPQAVERMSYGMPGYFLYDKPVVYFAGYKKHIGLYATPTGHNAFKDELSLYKQGKGSVQFPIDRQLPTELIVRIVKYRVDEIKKLDWLWQITALRNLSSVPGERKI